MKIPSRFSLQATFFVRARLPFENIAQSLFQNFINFPKTFQTLPRFDEHHLTKSPESSDLFSNFVPFLEHLSYCCKTKFLDPGLQVHAQLTKSGLLIDAKLRNHLINLYSKCRVFKYARKLLDESPEPDLVSWSAIISGYVQNGFPKEALLAFQEMQYLGIICNEFALSSVLKACAIKEDLSCGKQIHKLVLVTGFVYDVFVANTLVFVYAKCREFEASRRLFDEIPRRSVVSWNALFSCYVQDKFFEEAVCLFDEMVSTNVKPNEFSLSSMLNACAGKGDCNLGRKIHGYLIKLGHEADQFSASALVDMYAKIREMKDALLAFNNILEPNIVSWNAIIAGCVLHDEHDLAFELFSRMNKFGVRPNLFTLSSALKVCAGLGLKDLGIQLHSTLIKMDTNADLFIGVGLLDMYSKCGLMEDAKTVFKSIAKKDLIAWNAMISGYSSNGDDKEALRIFTEMLKQEVRFNKTSLSAVLKSITNLQDIEACRQMHAISVKSGLQSDVFVANSLIDSYRKFGNIKDAAKVFQESRIRDLASFTSMITAYSLYGQGEEALKLFKDMQGMRLWPDPFVCSAVLNACANLSAYEQGKQIHVHVLKLGYMPDTFAGNSLVNMYAKCGCVEDASLSFSKLSEKGIVSWSAMIGGLAQHGHGKEALRLFSQMINNGITPNHVTLVSVLYACSHAGLVEEAKEYFQSMDVLYGVKPTQEHYACMVDILSRGGRLDEALEIVNTMPYEANGAVWGALLGAAKIHKNVELGQRAAEKLFTLEPEKSGTHILLANLYASAGMWEKVSEMRKMMRENRVKKEPGMSWVEVKDKVHTFIVGDKNHPRSIEIYSKLNEIKDRIIKEGYVPVLETDLHDVERSEKELLLLHHSEKLAVAFALIATPPGAPIRIKKNLRICVDCHTAFKFVCKVVSREIIVRDVNRYHHFKNGSCSCGDYW
ncbi:pentatricopeptide repeat-containing protein At5g04780, mitochondrial-like [Amaranthus tricolor]|uniref:pentatricopeptide repeat-containing protein At5g04780, mitochondrial-like n=1 Tax=Amaranthus tricolor TaxID=29722 RepID=UPI00258FED8A|nr:pentatricopeptide repeat-containing protein At5g04780, mitochondrial-like [Amaranthus tricolor]